MPALRRNWRMLDHTPAEVIFPLVLPRRSAGRTLFDWNHAPADDRSPELEIRRVAESDDERPPRSLSAGLHRVSWSDRAER